MPFIVMLLVVLFPENHALRGGMTSYADLGLFRSALAVQRAHVGVVSPSPAFVPQIQLQVYDVLKKELDLQSSECVGASRMETEVVETDLGVLRLLHPPSSLGISLPSRSNCRDSTCNIIQ